GAQLIFGIKRPNGCKYCCVSLCGFKVNFFFPFLLFCCFPLYENLCFKQGNGMGRYPSMKFRVSSNDLYRRTAIIVEVNDKPSKKKTLGRKLPDDYWDFIPYDAQQEENNVINRRILSPVQTEAKKMFSNDVHCFFSVISNLLTLKKDNMDMQTFLDKLDILINFPLPCTKVSVPVAILIPSMLACQLIIIYYLHIMPYLLCIFSGF
ncbi:DNA-directed RNA polymerase IV subunit 1, partial [Mucuna pruriens]